MLNASELPSQRMSRLAIVSFVCCLLGPVGAIPAILCGHLARSACRDDPAVSGSGLALIGLLIGYVSVTVSMVAGAALLFMNSSGEPFIYPLN